MGVVSSEKFLEMSFVQHRDALSATVAEMMDLLMELKNTNSADDIHLLSVKFKEYAGKGKTHLSKLDEIFQNVMMKGNAAFELSLRGCSSADPADPMLDEESTNANSE